MSSANVYSIPSATVVGRVYAVRVDGGVVHCPCPAFTYRKACSHATEALQQVQIAPHNAVENPDVLQSASSSAQAEPDDYEPAREVQQFAAIIRWLRRHPVEMETMCWLAANDSDQPESWLEEMSLKVVKATLERFNLFYCAQCAGIVVWYSDRQVTWPSLQPHDHLEEKPEPVKVQPQPQRMTARRPIRFTEL